MIHTLRSSVVILLCATIIQGTTECGRAQSVEKDREIRLIVRGDDIGSSHAANVACIESYRNGIMRSVEIMVPCPWFPEIAAYAKAHPDYDFGLHLTLTAEWEEFKWGGAAPSTAIPSLLNEKGFMYASVAEVVENAKPEEVEIELRAQIERALQFGVPVTHLDSHMGTLFASPTFFEIYVKLGAEYKLPVFVPMNAAAGYPQLQALIGESLIPIDNYYMMGSNREDSKWVAFYSNIIEEMQTGLNLIIIHLAIDDAEMQAITINHPDFGSKWRENDLNAMLDKNFKAALEQNNIQLVTWRQVKSLLNK